MPITILCFATIREKIGAGSIIIDSLNEPTVAGLLAKMKESYPNIIPYFDIVRVAVNREFVSLSHVVNDGDEVALIPPVSGG